MRASNAMRAVADQDAVADLHRLADLVGNEHAVLPFCRTRRTNSLPDRAPSSHRARRTARRTAATAARPRTRARQALAHAAGERMRIVVLMSREPEPLQPASPPPAPPGVGVGDFRPSSTFASAAPGIGGRPETRCRSFRERLEVAERVVAAHGDLAGRQLDRPATRLNMVDLPQPVLPAPRRSRPARLRASLSARAGHR
jgi:hypothetical protein